LDTIVFCMTQHQTVIKSKMTLASGWFLEFQCLEESSYLNNKTYNKCKAYNRKKPKFKFTDSQTQQLLVPIGIEQESTDPLEVDLTARPQTQWTISGQWCTYMEWLWDKLKLLH
jgi:hypothetical protein